MHSGFFFLGDWTDFPCSIKTYTARPDQTPHLFLLSTLFDTLLDIRHKRVKVYIRN